MTRPTLTDEEARALAIAILSERLKAEHNWLKRENIPNLDLGSFVNILLAMRDVTNDLAASAGDDGRRLYNEEMSLTSDDR